VQSLRKAKIRTLSVTDGNDPGVSRHSDLAVLLPVLSEAAGATLALTLLDWVAYHATCARGPGPRRAIAHS
jgi:hypothetical protein